MRITCGHLEEMLPELVDGQLSGSDMDDALDHLATCDSCRLTVDQLGAVGRLYRQQGRLRLPDEARLRILSVLEPEDDM